MARQWTRGVYEGFAYQGQAKLRVGRFGGSAIVALISSGIIARCDIRDAVDDKATVPIYYESRLAKLDIIGRRSTH